MLTTAELLAISERAEKATAGPWENDETDIMGIWPDDGSIGMIAVSLMNPPNFENAEFIAHARTDIPKLLAHVAELEAKLAPYEKIEQRIINREYPIIP
jgi:hypothetical protein